MPVVRTFLKSEDAFVAASLLESEGIDATVIDDSAYGGNLLGATKGAIRIEVPENQLERAKTVLGERDPTGAELATKAPVAAPETLLQRAFRLLVVLELVSNTVALFLDRALYHDPPPGQAAEWVGSLVGSYELYQAVAAFWIPTLILVLLSSVLLFFYIRIGRVLFLATVAWLLFAAFVGPPYVPTNVGTVFGAVQWAIIGAIATLMFVPEVARRFRAHVGDPT